MRLIELGDSGGLLVRAIAAQRAKEAARTGLHVSAIVNDIAKSLYPKKYGSLMAEDTMYGTQEAGNVFEDICADQLRRRDTYWAKPDPRTHHGIIGSPDGYSARARAIDEIKMTWVSEQGFVTTNSAGDIVEESFKFLVYKWQFLFYADAWDAHRIRLHVLFVRGKKYLAQPRTFILKPTLAEKAANTKYLVQHAKDRGWLK